MNQVIITETLPEGRQRFFWPWEVLEDAGDYFVVKDPKNVRNGRQSVHQANLKAGFKKYKGTQAGGEFRVERIA